MFNAWHLCFIIFNNNKLKFLFMYYFCIFFSLIQIGYIIAVLIIVINTDNYIIIILGH